MALPDSHLSWQAPWACLPWVGHAASLILYGVAFASLHSRPSLGWICLLLALVPRSGSTVCSSVARRSSTHAMADCHQVSSRSDPGHSHPERSHADGRHFRNLSPSAELRPGCRRYSVNSTTGTGPMSLPPMPSGIAAPAGSTLNALLIVPMEFALPARAASTDQPSTLWRLSPG
jgi:hypothetical protein